MALSASLRRLLSIRQAEEDRSQSEMERANTELQRLESASARAQERGKSAQGLVASSVQTGELLDRVAGLQEIATVKRTQEVLRKRIRAAADDAQHKQQEFMSKRIARRQVEALIDAKSNEARTAFDRKAQSALDDWHRSQRVCEMQQTKASRLKSDISLTE
jgi:flagellar biosynthesis chaperone FliJ